MPNRVDCDVLPCFYHMNAHFDRKFLIEYALEHHLAKTTKEAECALSGLQQWLACLKHRKPNVLQYVMFAGPVNNMYTALIRNAGIYRNFCDKFMGDFVHTKPVTEEEAVYLMQQGCVDTILRELREAFSCELTPSLIDWFTRRGELPIVSVSSLVDPEESFTPARKQRWKTAAPIGAR